MPKALRFTGSSRDNYNNGRVTLKSTLDERGVNFSKISERKPMSHLEGTVGPGPGQYTLKSEFGKVEYNEKTKKFEADKIDGKGKTFGLGPEAYKNSFTMGMHKDIQAESEIKRKPGPGAYELPPTFGKLGKSAKLAFKFNDKFNTLSPGPVYDPNYKLVEQSRYQAQSMGYGGRYDFTKASSGLPGPEYNIPSKFDKYKNPREEELLKKTKERSKQILAKRQEKQHQSIGVRHESSSHLNPSPSTRYLSTYN